MKRILIAAIATLTLTGCVVESALAYSNREARKQSSAGLLRNIPAVNDPVMKMLRAAVENGTISGSQWIHYRAQRWAVLELLYR